MDLALNNLQWLICHKTQPTNQPTIIHKDSITGELPATFEFENKTASRKVYIADSRHNLVDFDFIESQGLLDIPLNSVCNAVSRHPVQNALTEQGDDSIKRFPQVFTNDIECCIYIEATLTQTISYTCFPT